MVKHGDLLALGAVGALALAGAARGSRSKAWLSELTPRERRLLPKVRPREQLEEALRRGDIREFELPEGTILFGSGEPDPSRDLPFLKKGESRVPVLRERRPPWMRARTYMLPRSATFLGLQYLGDLEYRLLTGGDLFRSRDPDAQLHRAAFAFGYDGLAWYQQDEDFRDLLFGVYNASRLPRGRLTLLGTEFLAPEGSPPW